MFRPCIDLHEGKVKQIVGGTLGDAGLRTNFVSEKSAAWFAELYQRDGLVRRPRHHAWLRQRSAKPARRSRRFPADLHIGGGMNAAECARLA